MIADKITCEWDEDGLHLIIDGDVLTPLNFRVADPEALFDAVRMEVAPWLRERDEARAAEMRPPTIDELEEDEAAYELTDPKHPRHHSVFADLTP